MDALRYVRMVLWAFFGIRRRAAGSDELAKANPIALVVMAIVLTLVFGVTLWAVARLAVSSL